MNNSCYLIVDNRGVVSVKKNKPKLGWNQISIRLNIQIPNELFLRPHLEATIKVQDIPNTAFNPELILNTKELIEQQTGAKIDFKIILPEEDKKEARGE